MNAMQLPTGLLIFIFCALLLVFIILFILLREFFTWYWKQNKIISLLESIDQKLSKITADAPSEDQEPAV